MIVLGLTGSIGMGKSTIAGMFAQAGAQIWDADAAVHRLYQPGGAAIAPLTERFGPNILANGAIDRQRLSELVLGQPEALRALEAIVHPLVSADREAFVARQRALGSKLVVLDIPLLLEGAARQPQARSGFDAVVVASASPAIQRARVLARPGMSPEKFEAILARQMPDATKRQLADFVINTSFDLDDTRAQVAAIVDALGL